MADGVENMNQSRLHYDLCKSLVLVVAMLLPAERMLQAACCGHAMSGAACCATTAVRNAESSASTRFCRCHANRAAPSPHRCGDCECSRVPQSMDRTTIKVSVSDESMCLATPLRGVDDTGLVPIARNELAAQWCTVLLSILYCRLLR